MALFIADTHALLWYLGGSPALSPTAKAAFDSISDGSGHVHVPAIVIAELIMLSEKQPKEIDALRIVSALNAQTGFQLTSLTPDIVLGIQPLKALHDIHDRLIVAEAIDYSAALITRDKAITASGLVPVVW